MMNKTALAKGKLLSLSVSKHEIFNISTKPIKLPVFFSIKNQSVHYVHFVKQQSNDVLVIIKP